MNISLVFGGESSEHDVSIKSFLTIYDVIKNSDKLSKRLKNIFYINRDGTVLSSIVNYNNDTKLYYEEKSNITIFKMFEIISTENLFLFSTIHGQYGEDGSLQGASKLFKIKSNLGNIFSTSISMDKHHLNNYLENKIDKLLIPKSLLISKQESINLEQFYGMDIIVKPNSMGSSLFTEKFCCSKQNEKVIKELINKIYEFDQFALVQEFIKGEEYSCGCLEQIDGNIALPMVKINSGDEFFSHKSKYQKGFATNEVIPIENDEVFHKQIKKISLDIFNKLSFNSMARFDYIKKGDDIYFLEANIIPGLKNSSIYPSMLKEFDYTLEDLIIILIENELKRDEKHTTVVYDVE